MDTYSILREFADSWVLLAMFAFFVGVVAWVFRPGGGAVYREAGNIPLRDDAHVDACAPGANLQTGAKDG